MKALQTLNAMIRQDLQSRYPEVPARFLMLKPVKATKANDLTKAVIKYIQLTGGQAERISVTGRRVDNTRIVSDVLGFKRQIGSTRWIKSSMQRGSADISATIKGKSVKIEIKVGKDRIRPEQEIYRDQVERAGGTYLLIGDFDTFYEWMNEFVK
jgi:hypothetical protein